MKRALFKKSTTQFCCWCDYRNKHCKGRHSRCKQYKEFVKKFAKKGDVK